MGFWETFTGVFMAQLLVWLAQWSIKEYIDSRWKKMHKYIMKNGTKIIKKIAQGMRVKL